MAEQSPNPHATERTFIASPPRLAVDAPIEPTAGDVSASDSDAAIAIVPEPTAVERATCASQASFARLLVTALRSGVGRARHPGARGPTERAETLADEENPD
jgi:hypothetical protein